MQQHTEPMGRDGPRRPRHLAPIKTSFDDLSSRKLFIPHPVETVLCERRDEHVSPSPPSSASLLRESKFNLRGLFNRSRSAGQADSEVRSPVTKGGTKSAQRPLRGNLSRSKTAVSYVTPNVTDTPPITSKLHSKDSGPGILRGRLSRSNKAWEPPPLFQAYPQAVKHDCLQASTLSAETILRLSNHKANKIARDQMMSSSLDLGLMEEDVQRRKEDDTKKQHRRRMSGSTSKPEWTQKIYVLATSGYLLQYSVEGNFDRLPEKVMQLGKESAAFASDAIPGKHWVLQISQTVTEEGVVGTNLTRSVLARMKARSRDHRTSTSNFLLVLDEPEEMEAWLVAVRKEIEALGGRKYRPEMGSRKTTDEAVRLLREKASHRYLIKRDPKQFPDPETPQRFSPCAWDSDQPDLNSWVVPSVETASMTSVRRQSYLTRPSLEAPSISRNSISDDRGRVDQSQEGSRLSYLSTGTRTLVASRGSSTATSSTKVDPTSADVSTTVLSASKTSMANTRRTLMQTIPPPLDLRRKSFDPCTRGESAGHRSTHADTQACPILPSISPSTPNFSVPSFSNRYTSATNGIKALNNPKLPLLAPDFRPPPPPPTFSPANDNETDLGERSRSTDETDRSQSWINTRANPPSTRPEESSTLSAQQFPRRFSSLEYSRPAPRSFQTNSHHTSKPSHPPPSTSLPALPSSSPAQQIPTCPLKTKDAKELRRPASMQASSSKPPFHPSTTTPTIFSLSGHKSNGSTAKLQNRKSRHELAAGPPAAPPPDCPLPPTPVELVGF